MARPEQTEKATPKRVSEARGRGQVARSPDVSGAAIFLAIIITLHLTFAQTFGYAAHSFIVSIQHANGHDPVTIFSTCGGSSRASFAVYTLILGVAFGAALVIGVVANVLQVGFLFAPKKIAPNFGVLNPGPGFKRLFFSVSTLVQLAKQVREDLGRRDHRVSAIARPDSDVLSARACRADGHGDDDRGDGLRDRPSASASCSSSSAAPISRTRNTASRSR